MHFFFYYRIFKMVYFFNLKKYICYLLFFYSLSLNAATPSHNYYTLTLSILSYGRWDDNKNLNLCVIENENITKKFQSYVKQYGYFYKVKNLNRNEISKNSCQVLYFDSLHNFVQFKATNNICLPTNTLTFTEDELSCESGSSFCLYKKGSQPTFNTNLDALSRTNIHIDPRVLLLSKNLE